MIQVRLEMRYSACYSYFYGNYSESISGSTNATSEEFYICIQLCSFVNLATIYRQAFVNLATIYTVFRQAFVNLTTIYTVFRQAFVNLAAIYTVFRQAFVNFATYIQAGIC